MMKKRPEGNPILKSHFLFGLLGSFSFALMSLFVKMSGEQVVGVGELLFLRGLIGVVCFLPFVAKELKSLINKNAYPLWSRAVFGAGSMLVYFWTIQNTSIGNARALGDIAPIIVALGAGVILKERHKPTQWIGVFISFLGILSLRFSETSASLSESVFWMGLLGAGFAAAAFLSLRIAATKFNPFLVVWLLSVAMLILGLIYGGPETMRLQYLTFPSTWGAAVAGVVGQIFLTLTFQRAKATIALSLFNLVLVWGVALEFIFMGAEYSLYALFSYMAIISGVSLVQLKRTSAR